MNGDPRSSSCLRLVNVFKRFGRDEEAPCVLDDISFTARAAHLHLLLGPSGSGKTTLLTLMAGLQRPSTGNVFLFDREIADYTAIQLRQLRARLIGFVFQDFQLIDSLTVRQNIALVLKFAGRSRVQVCETIREALVRFDIVHLRDRTPASLSQGEKQRVAIARAVVNHPELIIADEPTASLESSQGLEIIHMLRDYVREHNRSVVVASHDLRLMEYADTVHHLVDGSLRPAAAPPVKGHAVSMGARLRERAVRHPAPGMTGGR